MLTGLLCMQAIERFQVMGFCCFKLKHNLHDEAVARRENLYAPQMQGLQASSKRWRNCHSAKQNTIAHFAS